MVQVNTDKIKQFWGNNKQTILVVGAALLLTIALLAVRAGSPFAGFEAEGANLGGNAVVKSAINTSGGKYVEFSGVTPPNPPPVGEFNYPVVGPQSGSCSGVAINVGDNWNDKVSNNPTGTTFCVKAGIHKKVSVEPKEGQKFIGVPGAVLDGDRVPYAFGAKASNVTIKNLIIEDYNNVSKQGAIHTLGGANNWLIEFNEIRNNYAQGIRFGGKNWIMRNNNIHHNGQMGVTGAGADHLLADNEIAYNHTGEFSDAEEGGTKFFQTTRLTISGNWAHHNEGPALWTDGSNIDTIFEYNLSEFNRRGIFHEVSYDAIIRYNIVQFNNPTSGYFADGSGIHINTSNNTEIYGNIVTENKHGISIVGWNSRNSGGGGKFGLFRSENINIYDNKIKVLSGYQYIGAHGDNVDYDGGSITWNNNDYTIKGDYKHFKWGGGQNDFIDKNAWQNLGHDTNSSFKLY